MGARWKENQGWIACTAMFVIYAFAYGPLFTYNLLFTEIQRDLNATAVEAGTIGSMAMSSAKLSSPIAVISVTLIGYRRSLFLGIILASSCLYFCSYVQHVYHLYVLYGMSYGIGVNLIFFSGTCVILLHFSADTSYRTLIAGSGTSIGQTLFSGFVEFCIKHGGWRFTFQSLAGVVLFVTIPASYFVIPPDKMASHEDPAETGPSLSTSSTKPEELHPLVPPTSDVTSGQCSSANVKYQETATIEQTGGMQKPCNDERESAIDKVSKSLQRWGHVLKDERAWLHVMCFCFIEMAWTGYYVNIASLYETIGIFSYEAVVLVSTISVGDMVTKIALGIFGERLSFPKMFLVLFHNVIMTIVSCILPVVNNYFQIFLLSSIIGLMRPLGNNLPYLMGEELLGSEYIDEAVSITCMACGVGLMLGTFPVGIFYEATKSYNVSFMIVASELAVSSLLLVCLLLRIRRRN